MPPSTAVLASRRVSFETASVWALLLTVALGAVAFLPSQTLPFPYTKVFILAIGAIITLALYILARLTRGNVILPPSLMLGALWLPALAYVLSTFFSGVSIPLALFGDTLPPDTLGFVLILSVLGTLTALVLRRKEHYQFFLLGFAALAAFVLLAQTLIVVIGQFSPNLISPSTSLLGSFHDLATFAGLVVLGGLLSLRLLSLSGNLRIGVMVFSALALFVLALANTSFIWGIIALVSLGLFVEAVMRRAPISPESDLEGVAVVTESDGGNGGGEQSLAAPLVVLAISLFFLIGGNIAGALSSSLNASVVDVRPSWQSTLAIGKSVYADSPLFGSGPNTFGFDWLRSRDAALNQTIFWNVDFPTGIGFLPTSFVTTGAIGVLAWILLIAALLYLGARSIVLRASEDPFVHFVTIFAGSAAVYLLLIAAVLNAGHISLALLFIALGLFASVLRFAPGKTQWGIIFSRSPRVGFVVVFVLTLLLLGSIVVAYSLVERYIAQISVNRAMQALSANELSPALDAATQAISFAPSSLAYQVQATVAQRRMVAIVNDTSLPPTQAQQQFQQVLAEGITAALAATKHDPNNYQNWLVLGGLYAAVVPLKVAGAYENAKSAYEKAIAIHPTSPTIHYSVAQLALAQEDAASAREYLKKAIALKQDYTTAILLLSQLEVVAGNIKEARASAEAAAYFTPNDPNVLFQLGVLRAANGDFDLAITALQSAVAADGQFANARYFLAALYAKKTQYGASVEQLEAVAALSSENAKSVAPLITSLKANKNPFPANLLTIPGAPTSP